MTNRIFVFSGHLGEDRLGHALAEAYADAARKAGAEVRVMNLSAMAFDVGLRSGDYKGGQGLEPDLVAFQENLTWCTHWVPVYPLWWGGMPGPMKGMLDRTLLPGFAFQIVEGEELPAKLLTGRSARVLITSDTASNYYDELYNRAHDTVMGLQILDFVGFENHSFRMFSPTYLSTEEERAAWIAEAAQLGEQDALAKQEELAVA
ncbi:NAD(P)H dehydrogenase, quinone [Pseudovibrio sp. FO-BEG1]|uniref:NAD(P)H-dependent oxidoreductase n=1 Tax=Pseudovibrio sp. (strain FO-BEG1) TaxID=911045 RepID=UPI000238CEC2|nr:NAD(P)H-dependent oxidoreductase [Pseudovibrio sp. FO-BEG1]AEV38012.1 NAD(P)H dehydrogenase, quinone [Pseudovibrio sp. FO-BEG1]